VYYERQTRYDNACARPDGVSVRWLRTLSFYRDVVHDSLPKPRYRYCFFKLTGRRRHGSPRRHQQQSSGGGARQETLSGRVARHCRTICLRGPYTATAYRPITIL